MKIVFFSHTAGLGGGERSLLYLIKSLVDRVDIFVVIPQTGPMQNELFKMNVRYTISEYRWWTVRRGEKRNSPKTTFIDHLNSANKLINKIRLEKPDLIVTNTSVVCEGAIIAHILGVPHIWHIRELGEKDHGFIFEFGFAFTAKFINNFSSHIVFNSYATKNEFIKYCDCDKVSVVYNSIKIDKEEINQKADSCFYKKDSFKLLICGTISRKKNQIDAVRAVKLLVGKGYDVELTLLGSCSDKKLESFFTDYIAKHNLFNLIHVYNFINNPYPVYMQADAVIVTSKNEAFGRTIIEAMLLDKPVIATNKGGVPEIIENGVNGLLYSPGAVVQLAKHIELLMKKDTVRKALSIRGKKTAEVMFSNFNYSEKLLKLFTTTLIPTKPDDYFLKMLQCSSGIVAR